MHSNGLENPHAGIIRSIYETGVIGTLLFIAAFLTPIKKMYINNNINSKLIIFMLLMLGMYFAHRSAVPYIFLGTVLVVLKNKSITSRSSEIFDFCEIFTDCTFSDRNVETRSSLYSDFLIKLTQNISSYY